MHSVRSHQRFRHAITAVHNRSTTSVAVPAVQRSALHLKLELDSKLAMARAAAAMHVLKLARSTTRWMRTDAEIVKTRIASEIHCSFH